MEYAKARLAYAADTADQKVVRILLRVDLCATNSGIYGLVESNCVNDCALFCTISFIFIYRASYPTYVTIAYSMSPSHELNRHGTKNLGK